MINFKIKYIAFLIIFLFCYLLLIFGDYTLARYISNLQEKIVSKPQLIENKRVIDEDIPARELALKQNYNRIIFPDIVERDTKLLNLAKKLNIAPLAPFPNRKLYYCNEGYGLVKYKSDRFGFRNQDHLWDSQNLDFVIIGDSYVHGACVKNENTISGNLLKYSNGINLGVGGNNPIHYGINAKIFIPILKPKNVIMIFYANDNGAGSKNSLYYKFYVEKKLNYLTYNKKQYVLNNKLIRYYETANQIISDYNSENELETTLTFFERGNIFVRVLKYLSLPNIRKQLGINIDYQYMNEKTPFSSSFAINELKNVCSMKKCIPIIVYIPNSEFWRPDPRSNVYKETLRDYANKYSIEFIDLTHTIRLEHNKTFAKKGPHLSPFGYKLVAQKIKEKLKF